MALSKYDKGLLEFMYQLTLHKTYMNSIEISKAIKVQGKSVTDRTVRRWFKYLHAQHFDYFPRLKYNRLGLQSIWVLSDMDENVLKAIPHKLDVVKCMDLGTFKPCFLVAYLIPKGYAGQFRKFWSVALQRGLISCYRIFESRCPVDFYSSFHELVGEDGRINFPENYDTKHQFFHGLLKGSIEENVEVNMHDSVRKNPFIVPLVFEYFREHWSSHHVWKSMKRKLGDDIWKYIKDPKAGREQKDGAGIRFVQLTTRELCDNFDEFFSQMRVVYYPLYSNESSIFYLLLELKKRDAIHKLAEAISDHSLSMVVYPPMDKKSKTVMFYVLTNKPMSMEIMGNIIQPYIDKARDNKIILEDFKGSLKYWRRNSAFWTKHNMKAVYHKLFDPTTCTWKFDAKAYARKLH
jgi:hypothetical protein